MMSCNERLNMTVSIYLAAYVLVRTHIKDLYASSFLLQDLYAFVECMFVQAKDLLLFHELERIFMFLLNVMNFFYFFCC